MAEPTPINVCYVLAYRDPEYVRTRTLVGALESLDHVQLTTMINSKRGIRRYVEVLRPLLENRGRKPDVYLLGFRGHELYWPVRMIAADRPVILDAFLSPSDVLRSEAKHGRWGRLLGILAAPIEQAILRDAAAVLVDTRSHVQFFRDRFGVATRKVFAIPVGAYPVPAKDQASPQSGSPLQLLFYGSALPLHGLDVAFAALEQMGNVALRFRVIGGSAASIERLKSSVTLGPRIEISHSEWVPLPEIIAKEIPAADLCLGGPFGDTPQGRRVVTGKTFQFLAGCRATIVGHTSDLESMGFTDRENCLIVEQGDPQQLADAIGWAAEHLPHLPRIGTQGRDLFDMNFTIEAIAAELEPVLRLVVPSARVRE